MAASQAGPPGLLLARLPDSEPFRVLIRRHKKREDRSPDETFIVDSWRKKHTSQANIDGTAHTIREGVDRALFLR
jgi:hypothetical protein